MENTKCIESIVEGFFDGNAATIDDVIDDEIVDDAVAAVTDGLVDLGLPSGTMWAAEDLDGGRKMTWDEAKKLADESNLRMPTYRQMKELMDKCRINVKSDGEKAEAVFTSMFGNEMYVDISQSGWCNAKSDDRISINENVPYAWWCGELDEDGKFALTANVVETGYHRRKEMSYWPAHDSKHRCRLCTPGKKM